MSDLPAPRRYNEEEVRQLLERTAELLSAAPPASPGTTGLTLTELEEIAGEAGLDVGMLRRAASEMDAGGRPLPAGLAVRLAGAPVKHVLERTLPFEADESAFDDITTTLEMATTKQGRASQVGRRFTWSSQNKDDPSGLNVVVTTHSGETLVRIEERFDALAWGLFGGMGGGSIGLGVAGGAIAVSAGSLALGIALPVVAVVGMYTGARAIFRTVVNRRIPRLEELLDRISADLTRSAPDA